LWPKSEGSENARRRSAPEFSDILETIFSARGLKSELRLTGVFAVR
jgi:hypothetical protein